MSAEDKELKALLEKYHLPKEAGEAINLRNTALRLWGEFRGPDDGICGWYGTAYVSQRQLRWSRKSGMAPTGIIPDDTPRIELDPQKVADVFFAKDAGDYFGNGLDLAADILEGLPRIIDWLIRFEVALREGLPKAEQEDAEEDDDQ